MASMRRYFDWGFKYDARADEKKQRMFEHLWIMRVHMYSLLSSS